MFRVFHLAWSTCRAANIYVAGWRKLLRKVERGSTFSNKLWLCCSFFVKLATCLGSTPSKSTNQRAAFLQPRTIFFLRNKLITRGQKRETSTQNLHKNTLRDKLRAFVSRTDFAAFKAGSLFKCKQAWSMKDLFYGFRMIFSCGPQRVVPSGQDSSILPAQVANHNAAFGSSCPLTELVIKILHYSPAWAQSNNGNTDMAYLKNCTSVVTDLKPVVHNSCGPSDYWSEQVLVFFPLQRAHSLANSWSHDV